MIISVQVCVSEAISRFAHLGYLTCEFGWKYHVVTNTLEKKKYEAKIHYSKNGGMINGQQPDILEGEGKEALGTYHYGQR